MLGCDANWRNQNWDLSLAGRGWCRGEWIELLEPIWYQRLGSDSEESPYWKLPHTLRHRPRPRPSKYIQSIVYLLGTNYSIYVIYFKKEYEIQNPFYPIGLSLLHLGFQSLMSRVFGSSLGLWSQRPREWTEWFCILQPNHHSAHCEHHFLIYNHSTFHIVCIYVPFT